MPDRIIVGPNPGGQTEYLSRPEYEVCYAGETGSAKTWAIVYDALGLQYRQTILRKAAYEIPNYRGVIFRRKTTELNKIIDEGQKLYRPLGGIYVGQRIGDPGPSFNFPAYGSRIFCCHLNEENDKHNHDGIEYQFEGFDELQQFTLTQYLYLHSRLRSTVPGLFVRVRSTAMAVGEGLWWVKKRFITGTTEGKVYFFIAAEKPEENPRGVEVSADHPDARSRITIPGRLAENTHVNQQEYRANVKQLGKAYEKAMLERDWNAFSGDFFDTFKHEEIINPIDIPDRWNLICSIDPGWSGFCSVGLNTKNPEGKYYRIATYYEKERSPETHAIAIKKWIAGNKWTRGRFPSLFVCGHDAFSDKDMYSPLRAGIAPTADKITFASVFKSYGMVLKKATIARHHGWAAWKALIPDNYYIFKGENQSLVDQIVTTPRDEKDIDDIKGKGNDPTIVDHCLDEQRYAIASTFTPSKETAPQNPKWFNDQMAEELKQKWEVGMD